SFDGLGGRKAVERELAYADNHPCKPASIL
ncbi:TPA_asm: hypothetical protein, partial [ssRNA phage SRR7976299_6]